MTQFAIIPAAGRSRRMGRPKLLLRWGGATLLEHALAMWSAAEINRRIVVTHGDDHEIAAIARAAGAEVVTPAVPPPDMKASVRAALEYLRDHDQPAADDAWLLAPADMPRLRPEAAKALLAAAPQHPGAILVPTHQSRRGHPVLFRFSMTPAVQALTDDQGVNHLLTLYPVVELPVSEPTILGDVDTPEDFRNLTSGD